MKEYLLILISFFIFIIPSTSQVLINEVLADPGHYDGQGGEWFELYNANVAAADVSCWTVTDGEYIVVLPANTIIPANGHLLVYNANFFNCTSCNWDSSIISNLPATTIAIDLASCNCINKTSNCGGFILANSSSTGERLVLFDTAANIIDALNWGAPMPGIAESAYATGPNTFAGNIVGTAAGCALPDSNNYDLPATSDTIYENLGAGLTGCTTSWIRDTDGSATWTTDEWPSPGQTNSIQDFTVTYAINSGPAIDITNQSSVTLEICAGTVLDFSSDIFAFNQVYNSNAGDTGNQEGGSTRGGSNIDATGGLTLTDASWTETPITAAGVTNLSYTTTAINSNTTIDLFIKENTQGVSTTNANASGCPGSGTNISGSGAASNCYILKEIILKVIDTIATISYTCNNGLVTVTTTPATNFGSYTLDLSNSTNASLDQTFNVTTSPFSFQITQGNPADYSLVASSQMPSCAPTLPTVTGSGLCVFAPPCPTLVDTSCTLISGPVCPGDSINLGVSLSSQNLTDGMTIEWVLDTDNDNDVYDENASAIVATQAVTGGAPACPGGGANVFISELSDPSSNWQTDRYVEIYNAGPCAQDLTGWTLEVTGNNSADETVTLSGTLLAGQAAFIGDTANFTGTIDPSALKFGIAAPPMTNFNGQSRDGAILFDGTTVVDVAVINSSDNNDWFENSTISRVSCTPTGSAIGSGSASTLCGGSITACTDLTTNWGALTAVTPTPGTHSACPTSSAISITPNCVKYGVPLSVCNDTLRIKPRISPNQTGCSPGSPTPTLPTRVYTISCPLARIGGQSAICASNSTEFAVVFSNYGTCSDATIYYSLNGGASISSGLLSITNDTALVTGITMPGIYTLDSVIFSGCSSAICQAEVLGDHTVSSIPNPAKPVVTQPAFACIGQTVQLSASGGPDVNWYDDAALTNLVGSGNQINFTATAANQTLYLKVIDPNDGCESDSTHFQIIGNPLPTIVASALSGTICNGQMDTLIASGAASYSWSTSATGDTTIVSPSSQAIYTVVGTDTNSCINYDTVLVRVDDVPSTPTSVICANNAVTITPSNPSCGNSNCSLEYSADGINWSTDTTYTMSSPGWAGFGPGDTIFIRNASAALNGNDCVIEVINPCPTSIPLPIGGILLDGYILNNTAQLNWETFVEINMNYFEVLKWDERSNLYKEIGQVSALGNTNNVSSYDFVDVDAFSAVNKYRVKAIDIDGQFQMSNSIQLKNNSMSGSVKVYPTPASQLLNIEIENKQVESYEIKLMDMKGRIIRSLSGSLQLGTNVIPLDIENIANGIYNIQIIKNHQLFHTSKVLKSKK